MFCGDWKGDSKIDIEIQRTKNSKTVLNKHKARGSVLPDIHYKAMVIKHLG